MPSVRCGPVSLPVLQPVQRRRRGQRRYRPAVVGAVVLAGVSGGLLRAHDRAAAPRPPARLTAAPPQQRRPERARPLLLTTVAPHHVFVPHLTASSAIVVDGRSGRVLWALHAHERRRIASTTKIMTAVVALQRLRPHQPVIVPRAVTRVPLIKEGLRPGERVQAWKLFYGLLLYSGNDDALALAVAAAGSRASFVSLMNLEARRLGLRDSHFAGPSGVIDRGNYSSAWDLAALTRQAFRDARFRAIVRTRSIRVRWSPPTFAKQYVNKNLLLGSYRGADGVKTGWTTLAGHCLVASATRGRGRLIAVVLDAQDPYRDARRLLSYGFRVGA
jgi:serine-type D-Ala-D-Ala carboxypeptidase (penicillin-binding protein 5/6)